MKKYLFLVIIILIVVLAIILIPSRNKTPRTDVAEQTLRTFFDRLANKDYEGAYTLYLELEKTHSSIPPGETPSEIIDVYSSEEDLASGNRPLILKNYCEATGTCLRVLNAQLAGVSIVDENFGFFTFNVQFQNEDGSLFLFGPFGDDAPPQDTFQYEVAGGGSHITDYTVRTAPLYRP